MQNEINSYQNITELIGKTPLVRLKKISDSFEGDYYAKLESFNPGHSNKDRIALYIINDAEKKGKINKNTTIIETTSGNTGFSLAMICLVRGYKCILAVSSKSSKDKINILKSMGAKVYVCPSNVEVDNPRSYYEVAKKIHSETPNSFYINQYFNDLNIKAHFKTTGPEIWAQTNGQITHLIASSGTGGTISGCARYLKNRNKKIKIIGVDAYGSVLKKFHETKIFDKSEIYPYRIEGLGKNLIPTSTDFDVIDEFIKVKDDDSAFAAREITHKEGIFVGYTSGAVFQAVKYISKIYDDQWMIEQGFMKKECDSIIYV